MLPNTGKYEKLSLHNVGVGGGGCGWQWVWVYWLFIGSGWQGGGVVHREVVGRGLLVFLGGGCGCGNS